MEEKYFYTADYYSKKIKKVSFANYEILATIALNLKVEKETAENYLEALKIKMLSKNESLGNRQIFWDATADIQGEDFLLSIIDLKITEKKLRNEGIHNTNIVAEYNEKQEMYKELLEDNQRKKADYEVQEVNLKK